VTTQKPTSEFRVEKRRTDAVITLSSGPSVCGVFFTAGGSSRHAGPERVADLLNSEPGCFPFETRVGEHVQTVLYNRSQVVMVALTDDEARLDPGYDLAARWVVSALLSTGQRVVGAVRVYRPPGRDRLSDWARLPETFRYIETEQTTLLVNLAHIVEIREVAEP
jgi:hypothetical protein